MSDSRSPIINIIDKAIVVFMVIFLLSLSNSIFVNQLGYYGALLLFLIRWAVVKENPFHKSGLEFAFLWFIAAEIISTIFSVDQSHAFNNLLKRVLLLPIVFVMIASVQNVKRGRLYFNIYIAGTIITVLIYLYFAAQHYIDDLYGITQSGPSIFQYPITASEIISFTVIFLFAFLINEKTSWKIKLLTVAGFLLSLAALFSTYKRTGWIGAAFGILIVLIIKKQYKLIIAGFVLLLVLLYMERDLSRINIYSIQNGVIKSENVIDTDGRAFDVYYDDKLIISDYNNSIVSYEENQLTRVLETPAPVVSFVYWKDDIYLLHLSDTRFITVRKHNGSYQPIQEFVPPGYTVKHLIDEEILYVLDSDSGLTVYLDPNNPNEKIRYPEIAGFTDFYVNSDFLSVASVDSGFRVFHNSNGILADNPFIQRSTPVNFFFQADDHIYVEDRKGFHIFNADSSELRFITSVDGLSRIFSAFTAEEFIGFVSTGGKITFVSMVNSFPEIIGETNLGYTPNSVKVFDGKLYATYVKPSRLLSIFDPYNQSNMNRIALWKAGIKIWMDNPLFGVGDIDLAELYKQYKNPYDKEIQGHMHNNFIHLLVTLGLFGLLSVLFIFFRIIQIDLKIIRETKGVPFISSYAIGSLGAFCGFLFSGLTELNFWDHEITTLIWFVFGLNVALFYSAKPDLNN